VNETPDPKRMIMHTAAFNLRVPATLSGAIPDLVIGSCILIALAFVIFWMFDRWE
jgi:hypothetical protein